MIFRLAAKKLLDFLFSDCFHSLWNIPKKAKEKGVGHMQFHVGIIGLNWASFTMFVTTVCTHLIFILFFTIGATTLPLPHVLSLHTTWTPSTIRWIQREVNVLLRVKTDNVWWDIDKLFTHTGEEKLNSRLSTSSSQYCITFKQVMIRGEEKKWSM